MRKMFTAALVATGALAASGATRACTVAPFTANDTGGIISYSLVGQADIHALAADHCARSGKVARFTGAQPYQGGYLSFACVWVPPPPVATALRVRY
ncbi:MAG: hypothetical protein ACLP1D_29095 [Xanthobacteraceae bacterium]